MPRPTHRLYARKQVSCKHANYREGSEMDECVRLEVEIECDRHSELLRWAKRLNTTPEELAHRAIASWLAEMDEDAPDLAEESDQD